MFYTSYDGYAYRSEDEIRIRYENDVRYNGCPASFEDYLKGFEISPVAYTVEENEYGEEEWKSTGMLYATAKHANKFAHSLERANELDIREGLCPNTGYKTRVREVLS